MLLLSFTLVLIQSFCISVSVFYRSRNTDPVCSGLQAQILSCYRENRDQTLKCSDLAKEYMQCINAAKKVRVLDIYDFILFLLSMCAKIIK